MIEARRSERGGWKASQLKCLGIQWPPIKGWKRRIVGTHISDEQYTSFLKLATPRNKPQQLLLGKLLSKDFVRKNWDGSPEKFANDLYERCGRDLS